MRIPQQRKWICFVCGIEHEDYLGFKLHINDAHEEGREYIPCPKCEAPVRDVKAHFKLKHPGLELPKGGMTRATVWCDFSANGQKKKTRKPRFREGDFLSLKNGSKMIHYRSGLECSVYELLEQLSEVAGYSAEPLEIPYIHKGEQHNYRPDLAIIFADGRKKIVEIKPMKQTKLPINTDKWVYAKAFCEVRGWDFEVLTEVGIGKMKTEVSSRKRKNQ